MDGIPTNPDFSHLRWKESKTLTLSNGLICFAKSEAILYLGPREATRAGGQGQEAAPDWTDSTALRITTSPSHAPFFLPTSKHSPNFLTPRYSVLQTLILYSDTCVLRCGKRAMRSQLFPQTRGWGGSSGIAQCQPSQGQRRHAFCVPGWSKPDRSPHPPHLGPGRAPQPAARRH